MENLSLNGRNEGCFNCLKSGTAEEIPREDQTYCAKCFETLFESTFSLNGAKGKGGGLLGSHGPPKSKPPPPPTKPSKPSGSGDPEKPKSSPGAPFVCTQCKTSLHGKTVESMAGKVYCRICYEDHVMKVSCTGCKQGFTSDNVMVIYSEKPWHAKCFACTQCHLPIGPKSFSKVEDGKILCEDCYFEKSGKQCAKCKQMFSTSGFWFRNQHWHKACFTCSFCKEGLGDKEVFVHDDNVFCGPCYDEQFLKKCTACDKTLVGEIIEYESKPYHNDCFTCKLCKIPIGETSFFPREGNVFCENCYCMEFGKICKKCSLTISPTSGKGIVYRGDHYHRECFVCTNCDNTLTGQMIHSSRDDDKPFCGPCYDELYSKKCHACSNFISGVVGTKYISHEGKHWHENCFVCENCQSSLANRKIAFDKDDKLTCAPCLMTKNLRQ